MGVAVDLLEEVKLCMCMQVAFVQSFGMQSAWKEEEKIWRCFGAPEGGRNPFWLL
jgi:hypothetical protein